MGSKCSTNLVGKDDLDLRMMMISQVRCSTQAFDSGRGRYNEEGCRGLGRKLKVRLFVSLIVLENNMNTRSRFVVFLRATPPRVFKSSPALAPSKLP